MPLYSNVPTPPQQDRNPSSLTIESRNSGDISPLRRLTALGLTSVVAVSALATGCTRPHTEPRTVVMAEKGHREAWTQIVPIIVRKVTIFSTIRHPESWWVDVSYQDTDKKTERITVAEDTYNEIVLGSLGCYDADETNKPPLDPNGPCD